MSELGNTGMDKLYSMPTEEQETTINFTREDDTCFVWTSDKTVMTKLDKLCSASPGYYKVVEVSRIDGCVAAKEYQITDKSLLCFRSKKASREMTEEQKEVARQRLQRLRKQGKL